MSMLIVLPISEHDSKLMPNFAKVLAKFGGARQAEALIISSHQNADLIEDYKFSVEEQFAKVHVFPFTATGPTGWPRSCNHYFMQAAFHVEQKFIKHKCFYYLELDTLPLQKDWYEALLTEYNLAQKPFMGVREPTYLMPANADPETVKPVIKGYHMVGTGIYPRNLSKFSVIYRYNDVSPWDVAMQWEVAPKLHPTKLIQHNWGTLNYRMDDGVIVCDDIPNKPKCISHSKPVRSDAYLLHGCKDDSLANLLLSNEFSKVKTKK